MLIIHHMVNTVAKLKATPQSCGIEIDVRAYNDQLVLHHEPFIEGEDFATFLTHYKHAFLVVNIKCEGIEQKVITLLKQAKINNYFLLDVSPPFMWKLINQGVRKLATRFSEFESIETCLKLVGKIEWVFVDNLTHLPVENNAFAKLREHFKLCIVSPELLDRQEIVLTKKIIECHPIDAVLTDNIGAWSL